MTSDEERISQARVAGSQPPEADSPAPPKPPSFAQTTKFAVAVVLLGVGLISLVAGLILHAWQTAKAESDQLSASLANAMLLNSGMRPTVTPDSVFPAWPHWVLITLGVLTGVGGVVLLISNYIDIGKAGEDSERAEFEAWKRQQHNE